MIYVQDIEFDRTLQYNLMQTAVERFNETEKYLLENDLSERCLYGPLAVHLREIMQERGIRDYVVDTEYNRGMNGRNYGIKQIDGAEVSLDLIVHKRGYDEVLGYRNLLCAEMKKSNNRKGYRNDLIRLQKLTDQEHGFGYKMGFMLWVDQKQNVLQIRKIYVDGKEWSPTEGQKL